MDEIRILVVEDNPINQKVAIAMLGHIGYTADTAGNGQEAINAHRAHPYDIILMDCHMPVLHGLEATQRIRALERETGKGRCQIIAVTGEATASGRDQCLEAGMDLLICKPYRINDLRTAMDQAILNKASAVPV